MTADIRVNNEKNKENFIDSEMARENINKLYEKLKKLNLKKECEVWLTEKKVLKIDGSIRKLPR